MRNRICRNNVDKHGRAACAASIAQFAQIVVGDFINGDAQHYVHNGAERLGQVRAK